MLLNYILDKDGNPQPADMMEWAQWYETCNRHVAKTQIAKGVLVSTVFLGIDHSFTGSPELDPLHHRPVLWETMIFGGKLDQYQDRYTSLADAKAGHERAVAEARQAEAGFVPWLLRRRDELKKVWDVTSWFGFRRWYRKMRNKRLAAHGEPFVKASEAADRLNDRRLQRAVKRVVAPFFAQKQGMKFRDEK